MKKNKERYIDLSDIKDDELDKTGSFTDLMSRSELKKHNRKKEEQTQELKEILNIDNDEKLDKKKKKKILKEEKKILKEEKKLEKKAIKEIKEEIENNTIEEDDDLKNLSKTQKLLDLTNEIKLSMLNNVDENIKDEKKKFKIGNLIFMDILIIISLAYYIYSILFTNVQKNQLYILIGGVIILLMIMLFCISAVTGKKVSTFFSVINYLVFISFILFNLTLVLGIISI